MFLHICRLPCSVAFVINHLGVTSRTSPPRLHSDSLPRLGRFPERPMPQSPTCTRRGQTRHHRVESRAPAEAQPRAPGPLATAGLTCLSPDFRLHGRSARGASHGPRHAGRNTSPWPSDLFASVTAQSPSNIHQGRIAATLDRPLVIGGGTDVSYQHHVDSTGALAHGLSTIALSAD
jgi:hypothetical protein